MESLHGLSNSVHSNFYFSIGVLKTSPRTVPPSTNHGVCSFPWKSLELWIKGKAGVRQAGQWSGLQEIPETQTSYHADIACPYLWSVDRPWRSNHWSYLVAGRRDRQEGRAVPSLVSQSTGYKIIWNLQWGSFLWTSNGALGSLWEVRAVFAVCFAVHRERKNSPLSMPSGHLCQRINAYSWAPFLSLYCTFLLDWCVLPVSTK